MHTYHLNVNDSSLFDNIINLDRFSELADKNILFVSRIKKNMYTPNQEHLITMKW